MSNYPETAIAQVSLPGGEKIPALGIGTWRMGEDGAARNTEVEAIRAALDLGMTVVDTAEMYGDGGAERVVGEAMRSRRDEVFLVSKLYPHHATQKGTIKACEKSLERLRTDQIDLYLLHWRGDIPLADAVSGFARLLKAGKIRYWGVSNFDVDDMRELSSLDGGQEVAANQILYNLRRRGPETGVLPWCLTKGIPIMAYSPIDQGRLLTSSVLQRIGERHHATSAQIALAWLLAQTQLLVIPKASNSQHVDENRRAANIRLSTEDLIELNAAFPPPAGRTSLEMI